MKCKVCGSRIPDGAAKCPMCGSAVQGAANGSSPVHQSQQPRQQARPVQQSRPTQQQRPSQDFEPQQTSQPRQKYQPHANQQTGGQEKSPFARFIGGLVSIAVIVVIVIFVANGFNVGSTVNDVANIASGIADTAHDLTHGGSSSVQSQPATYQTVSIREFEAFGSKYAGKRIKFSNVRIETIDETSMMITDTGSEYTFVRSNTLNESSIRAIMNNGIYHRYNIYGLARQNGPINILVLERIEDAK